MIKFGQILLNLGSNSIKVAVNSVNSTKINFLIWHSKLKKSKFEQIRPILRRIKSIMIKLWYSYDQNRGNKSNLVYV